MNSKKKFISGIILLILLGSILWIWLAPSHEASQESAIKEKSSIPTVANPSLTSEERERQELKKRYEEEDRIREADRQALKSKWRTPIVFYGKVIDEKDQPVVGAEIKYSCNSIDATLTQEEHYEGKAYSDAEGMFKIEGIKGIALTLNEVTHADYYASTKNKDGIGYALGRDPNVPDVPEKAWVFRMYKKKVPVALISGSEGLKASINGAPGVIRLGRQGQVQVEAWANPPAAYTGKSFDWRVRFSVPGGGIIESTQEFNFEAPQNGYNPSVEINMTSSQKNWAESVRKTYILNLGKAYARMNVYVNAGQQIFVSADYLINPTGSPNLEYDPTKKIENP
jgi:hypothetical protein